jgi:hypothetical protein
MAKPAARPIAEETEKTELRNSRSGSTGSAAYLAEKYQVTRKSTAATNRPMITGEDQA